MLLTPRLRKLALTGHVTFSVAWLGAALAYLAVAIAALRAVDVQLVAAAVPTLELIGWYVIVPCSIAALGTGLLQSLATPWGLVRHYWILAKLALTVIGTVVLLGHMPTVSRAAEAVRAGVVPLDEPGVLPFVIHAALGCLLLVVVIALSVFKPWGKTPWRQRSAPAAS